ncbi:MAG: glycosyltransferase [Acidobacteriaceae bacterium]|nr:glycosyltransferase [Acidobacteriaceae bacterium]
MSTLKVLLMAYECSPYRGSEWAVGWGRLLQAARVAETHVITGEENFHALERARGEGLLPENVHFYTPEPDAKLRARDPHAGMFAYHYGAYQHWQQLAFPLAESLHREHGFDVVHQVTVNTFREPSYAWQLEAPFVWGPVGGSQNFPLAFLPMLPAKEAAKELVRAGVNHLSLRLKPRVRAAAHKASIVFASNSTNAQDYRKAWGREIECLLETGLAEVNEPDRTRFEQRAAGASGPLKILWSGELQTRKALPVLLRALVCVKQPFQLTVLGDGPMRPLWESEAATLGLADRVTFCGRLPFPEAVAAMQKAELFCFTSLRDTSGNVVLEALAAGVPVVCFDHQGAGDMVSNACGVKIAVTTPTRSIQQWAQTIDSLAQEGERLLALSRETTAQARKFLWSANGDRINAVYRELARVRP